MIKSENNKIWEFSFEGDTINDITFGAKFILKAWLTQNMRDLNGIIMPIIKIFLLLIQSYTMKQNNELVETSYIKFEGALFIGKKKYWKEIITWTIRPYYSRTRHSHRQSVDYSGNATSKYNNSYNIFMYDYFSFMTRNTAYLWLWELFLLGGEGGMNFFEIQMLMYTYHAVQLKSF